MKSMSLIKTLLGVAASGLALVALAACGGGGGGASDEAAVRSVLDKEIDALRKQDPRALYNLYSPQARSACPYDDNIQAQIKESMDTAVNSLDIRAAKLELSGVSITVTGNTATATSTLNVTGKVAHSFDLGDETYQKIDGHWYPANPEGCGDSASSGSANSNAGGDSGDDVSAVKSLLKEQLNAYRTKDWSALYNMLPPKVRAACQFAQLPYVGKGVILSNYDITAATTLELKNAFVKVDGNTAQASYDVVGKDIKGVSHTMDLMSASDTHPDVFTKVDGHWYAQEAMASVKSTQTYCQAPPTPQPTRNTTLARTATPARAISPTARAAQPTKSATPQPSAKIDIIARQDGGYFPIGVSGGVVQAREAFSYGGQTRYHLSYEVSAGKPLTVSLQAASSDPTEASHSLKVYEDEAYTIPVAGADTGATCKGKPNCQSQDPESTVRFTVIFDKAKKYYFRCEFRDPSNGMYSGVITAK